jgi:hypothetical protein
MLIVSNRLPYLACKRFKLVAPSVDMARNKKAPQRLGFGALIKGGKVLRNLQSFNTYLTYNIL